MNRDLSPLEGYINEIMHRNAVEIPVANRKTLTRIRFSSRVDKHTDKHIILAADKVMVNKNVEKFIGIAKY